MHTDGPCLTGRPCHRPTVDERDPERRGPDLRVSADIRVHLRSTLLRRTNPADRPMSPLPPAKRSRGRSQNTDERRYPQMHADGSCPPAARATAQSVPDKTPNGAAPMCVHLCPTSLCRTNPADRPMSPLPPAKRSTGQTQNTDERRYPQMHADGPCPPAARAIVRSSLIMISNGAAPICVHLRSTSLCQACPASRVCHRPPDHRTVGRPYSGAYDTARGGQGGEEGSGRGWRRLPWSRLTDCPVAPPVDFRL
jgi:hypothetical protein